MLASFLCREFLFHIPCWLSFYVGSFSYTSHAAFIFMQGVSLTHPVLSWFLCREFLLHIPCWLLSFFIWGVSLTHPVLVSFFPSFFWIMGVSLTRPMLPSFLSGEFYTSRTSFIFIWGVFLCSLLSNSPLRKELGGSWSSRKVWKCHIQTREGSPRTTRTEQNITKQELSEKWAQ